MPNSQGEALFTLITSLSKAEKRNFSLYTKRLQGEGDIKFLQLFNHMEKLQDYDEEALRLKMGDINKTQFTNLRRSLYQHLLTSLRLVAINKRRDFQIRELIDYAYILYGKGLYLQALKLLQKAKGMAMLLHRDILHLEIIEFEKRIQSRHITRSSTDSIQRLMQEASLRQRVNANLAEWSNLKLLLQRLFINEGHLPGEAGKARVDALFESKAPRPDHPATFFERVYRCESFFWRHYLALDLNQCLDQAREWVDLFRQKPTMIAYDVDMYLRGLNHLLTTAFYTANHTLLSETLDELESFCRQQHKKFLPNSRIIAFLYRYQGKLNKCFLSGAFDEGARKILPRLQEGLREYGPHLDQHKVMIMDYKIAWLHLARGKADQAVELLQPFTFQDAVHLREEMQSFAHIMLLMAHYELGNFDLLPYLLRLTRTAMDKMKRPGTLPVRMVAFFQQVHRLDHARARTAFVELRPELQRMAENPDLRRECIFLDALSWVEAQIEQQPLQEVIRKKFQMQRQAEPASKH